MDFHFVLELWVVLLAVRGLLIVYIIATVHICMHVYRMEDFIYWHLYYMHITKRNNEKEVAC